MPSYSHPFTALPTPQSTEILFNASKTLMDAHSLPVSQDILPLGYFVAAAKYPRILCHSKIAKQQHILVYIAASRIFWRSENFAPQ